MHKCANFTRWSPIRCSLPNPRICRHFDVKEYVCSMPWRRVMHVSV